MSDRGPSLRSSGVGVSEQIIISARVGDGGKMSFPGHQAKSIGAGVKPAFSGRLRYQTFVGLLTGLGRWSSSLENKGDDHVHNE